MKILIISDSHGNLANLKHVMGFGEKINVSAVIHCGDWNDVEAVKTVLEYKIPLYSVLGNADIDPKIENLLKSVCKKFDRLLLNVKLGGKTVQVIHKISDLIFNIEPPGILFFGHDHRQRESSKNGTRTVNPGALENDINFAIYDTETNKVELING